MRKFMPEVTEALVLLAPAAVVLVVAGIGPAVVSGLVACWLYS